MEENTQLRMDLTAFSEKIVQLRESINKVIVGQDGAVDMLLTAILADGHVLLEGVPGVAKTLLARLLSRLIDARFSRLQFTPDLMPSDVLGTTVFNMKTSEFDFHAGPVFSDLVLVDEINRAQATIDGITHSMGSLFTVIATQNPVEQEGTYKLPEAQIDRFMMKIVIGYPSLDDEVLILQRHQQNAALVRLDDVKPVLSKENLLHFRDMMSQVLVEESLLRYMIQLVQLTRTHKAVYLGASPRAAVALLRASKAFAMLQGRDFVTPDDVKAVAPAVLQHRLFLTAEAEMEGLGSARVVSDLLKTVEVPK